jgi:hypothetical protein
VKTTVLIPATYSFGRGARIEETAVALVEAVVQLTRALDQIATLPGTPSLRREQINLQVAQVRLPNRQKHWESPCSGCSPFFSAFGL